ncbi:MAG TPA: hypothetical protein VK581_06345 [Chthoniobacterales bacterium]|nr:hypothetical protein [Chthoniobacterales bacterium]
MTFPIDEPSSGNFRRGGFAIGLCLVVAFKFWLVHTERIYGSATEFDALWYLNAAKHWYWGSDYSWTAFTRPPAYPLFVALIHLCGIPLRIGIELIQMGGYLALVAALRKAGLPRTLCLVSYASMVLHPGSFQQNSYTMADSFYAAILPLILGGLLLTLFTAKIRHALWAGLALAVLWNIREESFLIPPLLLVFLVLAVLRKRTATHSWKTAARAWLKPAGTILLTLILLVLSVGAANYRAFHSFTKSDLTSSSFQAAYKALLRIKPSHDQRFVSVSTEALEIAYKISPTFAQLKPELEGEPGRNWQVPAFTALGLHEIGAPWFLWALRHAANLQGMHHTPTSANRFYRKAAREISRACDEGRNPSRLVFSSFLDPGAIGSLRYLPESLPRIAGLFLLRYPETTNGDDAILTEPQRALYDEMTGRGAAPRSPEGWSKTFQNFIGSYHRFLVLGLSVAGIAALLILGWQFRRFRIDDPPNTVLILLGATILLRVALFTFLDATWWIGGYERYLFPVAPLYSCFLILLIYQSIAVLRRTGKVI